MVIDDNLTTITGFLNMACAFQMTLRLCQRTGPPSIRESRMTEAADCGFTLSVFEAEPAGCWVGIRDWPEPLPRESTRSQSLAELTECSARQCLERPFG